MPTEVTKIVDPGEGTGHDYHSLSLWEAGEQGDLTGVRNEIAIAKCRATDGVADTTTLGIAGWTTSSTQYIKIWTDPAESYRHSGKLDATKYRLSPTSGRAIIIITPFVRIDGIQIDASGSDNDGIQIDGDLATLGLDVQLSNLIMKGNSAGSWSEGFTFSAQSQVGKIKIWNTIVYGFGAGTGISTNTGSQVEYFYNITSVGNLYGFLLPSGNDAVLKNCLANHLTGGYAFGMSGGFTGSLNYCASDDASSIEHGGTGNRINQVFTFVDAGADDYHLASNDAGALGYGLNLYNDANLPFQDDIDGQDRGGSGASWDIGADEYVAAGGLSIPVAMHHYKQAGGL